MRQLLLMAFVITSCVEHGREHTAGGGLQDDAPIEDIPTPKGVITPPAKFCADAPLSKVAFHASTLEFHPRANSEHDDLMLLDLATRNGRLYGLDEAGVIVVMDTVGTELFRFGRKGNGPGELNGAVAIDADRAGNVYVLAGPKLHMFDAKGQFIRSFNHELHEATDVAATDSGFVIVADVKTEGTHPARTVPYAIELDKLGNKVRDLLTVNRSLIGKRPLSPPTWSAVNVTAQGSLVAIWYKFDHSVDIFRNGKQIAKIRGCMPQEFFTSFESQRKYGPNFQAAFQMISGVWLEEDGDVWVLTGHHIDGKARLQRFDSNGKAKDAYEFEPDRKNHAHTRAIVVTPNEYVLTFNQVGDWNRWNFNIQ